MELIRTPEEKRRRFTRWYSRKAITYVAVCAFLTLVNALTSPGDWWVVWVIAGWGLGMVLSLAYYLFDCDEERNYDNP